MSKLTELWNNPDALYAMYQLALPAFVVAVLPLSVGNRLHSQDRASGTSTRAVALLGTIALCAAVFAAITAFPGPHVAEFGSKLGPFAWIALLLGVFAAAILVGYAVAMAAVFVGLKR